jgi:hypothetical protein
MEIREGLEFYFPRAVLPAVIRVTGLRESLQDKRGRSSASTMVAETADDYGSTDVRAVWDLQQAFERGWAVEFTAQVPRSARIKILRTSPFNVSPDRYRSAIVDGQVVCTAVWLGRLGTVTDQNGKVVRKKKILDQVAQNLDRLEASRQ